MNKKFVFILGVLCISIVTTAQDFTKGYCGFVDAGYTIGPDCDKIELSTTHGYQVSPYFFVGGGLGFHYDVVDSDICIPFFADLRGTFTTSKFAPFVDLKLGYFISNGYYDAYSCISAGVRMNIVKRQAVSLSVGFPFYRDLNSEGVSIKLGYEF